MPCPAGSSPALAGRVKDLSLFSLTFFSPPLYASGVLGRGLPILRFRQEIVKKSNKIQQILLILSEKNLFKALKTLTFNPVQDTKLVQCRTSL